MKKAAREKEKQIVRVRLRVKEIAKGRGMSLSQIQRETGLTIGMVRRYWYNKTGEVSLDAIATLATLFQISPGELLTVEPEKDGEDPKPDSTPDDSEDNHPNLDS